jgi:hypothetical protein
VNQGLHSKAVADPDGRTGQVTVSLRGLIANLKARRVLATVADIDHVVVVLQQAGQPDRTQVVPKTSLNSGQATATFTGLTPGPATITMTAYDAAGANIGSATQPVTVVVDNVTPVEMTVTLVPTVATPAPSGGGTSGTGSVTVTGTFVDGPIVSPSPTPTPAGTVLGSFNVLHNMGFTATGNNKLYVFELRGMGMSMGTYSGVVEVSADDGTELWSRPLSANQPKMHGPYVYDRVRDILWFGGPMVDKPERADRFKRASSSYTVPGSIALDGLGNVLAPIVVNVFDPVYPTQVINREYRLERTSPDRTFTVTSMAGVQAIAVDPAGNTWTGWVPSPALSPVPQASLRRYAPDGSLIDTISLPFVPRNIRSDGTGAMWVTDGGYGGSRLIVPSTQHSVPTANLVKVEADGTVGTVLTMPIDDFQVDDTHHLWVATGASVVKLRPDGTTALTLPYAANFVSSGDGIIYIGDGAKITKLAP